MEWRQVVQCDQCGESSFVHGVHFEYTKGDAVCRDAIHNTCRSRVATFYVLSPHSPHRHHAHRGRAGFGSMEQ